MAPNTFIDKIIPYIKDKTNKVFADIGCGDGCVLSTMHGFFDRLIGVEYDQRIAKICKDNLARQKIKNVTVYQMGINQISDALIDSIDIFYLYNPFHGDTFANFIANVNKSVARKPREIMFIYANPICRESANQLSGFNLIAEFSAGGSFNILIYKFAR